MVLLSLVTIAVELKIYDELEVEVDTATYLSKIAIDVDNISGEDSWC